MTERKFTISNRADEKLVCVEVKPDNPKEALPAVILCHGFAYYKEEDGMFTGIAKRLADAGYAVFYFDFSGCGESEGDYSRTSLTKLVEDLRSVYDVVARYDHIDSSQISLIGQSFGTSVCIASEIKGIQRMVLCGSFYDPYKLFKEYFQEIDESGLSTRAHSDGTKTTMGPQFWSDLKTYHLEKTIAGYECPILFVHGKLDTTVTLKWMEPLFDACQHPVGPVILEKSDHGLRPERERLFEAVENFFTEKVSG